MKRHGFLLRTLTPALAALFVLTQWVDGSGAHRCPMHDAVVVTSGAHHSAASHHGTPDGDHQHHGICTCLGACHSGAVALAAAATALAASGLPAATALLPMPSDPMPGSPAYLLPFAIGPPLPA